MQYLTKTLPIYGYEHRNEKCDVLYMQRFRWDEVEHDDDQGPMAMVGSNHVRVRQIDEVPARWWTVGVYTTYQVYGGPEEGGWWYAAGSLTEHGRMRFFDDYAAAQAYSHELWDWVQKQNTNRDRGDERLTVRCTTEALPDAYYPKKRPYYS